MFKKYTLNKQIQLSFLAILVCTLVSTFLAGGIFLILSTFIAYPANYYDRQIPEIMSYVQGNEQELLTGGAQMVLESQLDLNQTQYEVINFRTGESYGNHLSVTKNEQQLIQKINTMESDSQNNFTRYVPLTDSEGNLSGCFVMTYPIRLTPIANQKLLFGITLLIVLILPFIFLILYMWLFGKKLTVTIREPLRQLQWASNKIRNQDLDFKLDYDYPNELGQVITSFEQMREQLNETLYHQWHLEQRQKEMLAALAHDLRSPLTIIKGHVELLQDGSYRNEDRCLKYLDFIEEATNRATLLVEDLNLLSDLNRENLTFHPQPICISLFLKNKVMEYQTLAQQRNIELILKVDQIVEGKKLMFDELRLSQIIDNIIMNAFRYTKSYVVIILQPNQINELQIVIYDDGPGFTGQGLKKALDKFYRGDESRSQQGGHSGLGLYICQCLTEQQGGKISLSNHESGGACVTIDLPL